METGTGETPGGGGVGLETFLRGMETRLPGVPAKFYPPLKPSLEGWKREVPLPLPRRAGCLETFLRGMETRLTASRLSR